VRLPGEGVVNVSHEVGDGVPARSTLAHLAGGRGLGWKVPDQYGETTEREPAAVQVSKVDAVEALEIGLYGAAVLTE